MKTIPELVQGKKKKFAGRAEKSSRGGWTALASQRAGEEEKKASDSSKDSMEGRKKLKAVLEGEKKPLRRSC